MITEGSGSCFSVWRQTRAVFMHNAARNIKSRRRINWIRNWTCDFLFHLPNGRSFWQKWNSPDHIPGNLAYLWLFNRKKKSINWKMMAFTSLESQCWVWLWNFLYLHCTLITHWYSSPHLQHYHIFPSGVFQIWASLLNSIIEKPLWRRGTWAWCIKKFSWKFPCSWKKVEQPTKPVMGISPYLDKREQAPCLRSSS